MRLIKAEPQPVLVDEGEGRWLYPSPDPNVWGGLWFSYPIYSLQTGEFIPCKGGVFDGRLCPEHGMELLRIDGVWYWKGD